MIVYFCLIFFVGLFFLPRCVVVRVSSTVRFNKLEYCQGLRSPSLLSNCCSPFSPFYVGSMFHVVRRKCRSNLIHFTRTHTRRTAKHHTHFHLFGFPKRNNKNDRNKRGTTFGLRHGACEVCCCFNFILGIVGLITFN